MAGKVYEIGFKIAGDLSGNFQKTFKSANTAVQNFNKNLNLVNKSAADVSALIKQKTEVANASRAYIQAKEKVAQLGRAISQTKNPTKEMVAEFNRAKSALDKTKRALDTQRNSLKTLESQTGITGQSLKTLIAREKELARAADRTRIAQEKRQKAMDGMKSGMSGAKENAGYAATSAAAIGAGLGASVSTAMSFENQRAELRKFSDESEKIFSDILKLTSKYAKTSEDLTGMATAAMQAGIAKTSEDVAKIIEAQTQAAVAFDMTGEQVGDSWAAIQSRMGMTVDQTKDVFDIVNKLGNETSASSADIIEVLERQGGTLKGLTALSSEQITALAGAFRSAAPSAEVAATSMATFVSRLTMGEAATKAQADAMEQLGVKPVELAKALTGSSKTAQGAIQDIFAKINELPKHKQGAVIGTLFGNEAGIKSAVSTLAKQGTLLSGNFDSISSTTKYAGSMLAEYQNQADTTSNSMGIAKNNAAQMAASIGNILLPYLRSAADYFNQIAPKIMAWIQNNRVLVTTFVGIGAAVAGLAAAAIPLFVTFKTVMFYANLVKVAFNGLKLVFTQFNVVSKLVTASQAALNLVMSMNPIAKVILVLTALIAVGVLVYKNWDTIKAKALSLWATFSEKFPSIANIFTQAFGRVKAIASDVKGIFTNLIGFVKNVFTGQWSAAWENVKGVFGHAFSALVGLVKLPFQNIISIVNTAIKGINNAVGKVKVPDWVPVVGGKSFNMNIPTIPQLAEGGIATKSTLANIGEGREAEAVLPLSKLDSMLSKKGRGGGPISVSFSPTINVTGGGDVKGDVQNALNAGLADLEKKIERIMANKRRLSFA